jgi:glycosyltransferase involved in cell wall biosynthesis
VAVEDLVAAARCASGTPAGGGMTDTLLSINNYHYRRGGAEVVFLEHNRLFTERGWRVVPFSMQHEKNLPSEWSGYFAEELEFGARYSAWQQLRRVPRVIWSMDARRQLGRLLDAVQPRVAHAHNIYHHLSPSILGLLRARGVPVVLTVHDLKLSCPAYSMNSHGKICERCKGGKLYNVVTNRCIKGSLALSTLIGLESVTHRVLRTYERHVNAFAAPSRFIIDKLVSWGWDRSRFRHIPNFVDVDAHVPSHAPGEGFVYFGRLSREKGIATLIRAAALSGQRVKLVGTGPQEQELRELAAGLNAPVEFAGFQSGKALHDHISSARAVVLASECYENAPLSILEGYALGRPSIGAGIAGIPELIREGETGFVFEVGNPQALADALSRAAALPPQTLVEMGRAGRRWVEESFGPAHYAQRMSDLYAEIAGAP